MYADLGPGQMIELEPPSSSRVELLYSDEYVARQFVARRRPPLSPAERANHYAYVMNNPVSRIDPWGLQAEPGSGGFWDSLGNSWGSMQNTYAGLISEYWYGDPNATSEFYQQAYNRGPLGQTARGPGWSYYGTRGAIGVAATATAGAVVVGGTEVAIFGRSAIYATGKQSSILVEGAAVGGRIGSGGLFQIRPAGQRPWLRFDYHPFSPYRRSMPHIDTSARMASLAVAVSRVNAKPLTQLTIHDRTTLESASARVHDGVFSLSNITFDERSQVFRLVFYLPDDQRVKYRRILWPLSRRSIWFATWELAFSSVRSCHIQIEDDTNVNSLLFEIGSILLDPNGTNMVITTHFVVTIDLVVAELSGEVRQLSADSPIAPSSSLVIRPLAD